MATKVLLKNREITTLPMIPMRGVVVFPDTVNHFDVSRKRSINAIEQAMKNRTPIFLLTQRDVAVDEPQIDDMFRYGVVADVKQILRITDDIIKVLVNCNYRAKIIGLSSDDEFYYAQIAKAPIHRLRPDDKNDAEALVRTIREQLDDYMEHYPKISGEIIMSAYASTDPSKLVEFLAFNLNFDYAAKQRILSESSVIKRLQLLLEALVKENNVLNIEREINDKVQESIDKNQREYYLREQIRTISTELGDTPDTLTEADEYRKKITALPLEDTYKTKLQKEVERLVQTPANSQESAVIRTYLDTVVELPWSVCSDDNFDLKNAEKILDRDHFGLEKVKERILEFLAVRSLTGNFGAQIICLVGPPGVGKTSIARSVAECMNRKFVRMSLGGIKDESEIRGHRRTYVASMPGRIIASIEQAGTSNPVILLDEIDKLGNDFRGDPASALLEVLDPEQNNSFRDHFLDLPYDLSKVLFLTTANDRGAIPGPLLDRMDVIEISSYTRQEKFKIAKLHLLRKQIEKHGLNALQFGISDSALYRVIDDYTREAGVRQLERQLAKLIRKSARKLVSKEMEKILIESDMLEELLGPSMTRGSITSLGETVGVVNGLAWTSVGGETMPVEVTVVKGSGKLEITGSLGDIMKESAKLALTYCRTLDASYDIPENLLKEYDIHIHAPEGAVPKDGPSAGVTLATALVSAISGMTVRRSLAMTGEITLKGKVIAIGGLKEKLIAAYKEKIKTVIIPKDNVCDLVEIPSEVTLALKIIPVEKIDEVLSLALIKPKRKTPEFKHLTAMKDNADHTAAIPI